MDKKDMELTKAHVEEMRGVLCLYWNNAGHDAGAPNALCDAALYWLHAVETNMIRDGAEGVALIKSEAHER